MNNALKGTVVVAESAAGGILVGGLIEFSAVQCQQARFFGTGGDGLWCGLTINWQPYAPGIGVLTALIIGGIASWWYFKRTGNDAHEA